MIVSLVLEKPFGNNAEGDVVQVEQEIADSLISAGVAREASTEDMGGNEEVAEEVTEEDDTPALVQDQLAQVTRRIESTLTKATEKAVEKTLASTVKRPGVKSVPMNRHVAGSDEALTGGFKNLGDFAFTAMRAKGDYRLQQKLNRVKALTFKGQMTISGDSGHAGGDLVPQQWAKDLWKLSFDKVPDLLGMCMNYPMENQVLNIPSWVQASAASGIVANVTSEASAITDTKGVTATVQLNLVKFTALVNTTDELMRFNSYALDSVLKQVAPQRIRYLVNDSIVNGTNSQVNLVGNAAAVTVHREVSGHFSFNDITKMEAALFSDFVDDAVWLVNNSSSPELYGLSFPSRAASTQFPAFTPGVFASQNLLGPKPVGELLGKPVYRLENVPALGTTGDLILYSPKSIASGSTGLIADGTPYLYFNQAIDTWRFMWYADTVNPLTTAYTRKDGSQASNIVVLGDYSA